MSSYDAVVVGAGVSGASFAHRCAKIGLRTLLIERDRAPGGCIRSHRLASGYWCELGAHTCYNTYGTLLGLVETRLGLSKLQPRTRLPYRLLIGDKLTPILKELRIPALLAGIPRLFTTSKQGKSVRDYYSCLVGRANYERVFRPLFAAVPSQPADAFPADMLFKKRPRVKDLPRSFTLEGGLGMLVDGLVATPGIDLKLETSVERLDRQGAGFSLELSDGSHASARFVGLAAPPPVAADLTRQIFPELAAILSHLAIASVESIAAVVRRDALGLEPLAGVVPLDGRFFSAVSRDVVPDPTFRAFTFHFPPGGNRDARLDLIAKVLGVAPSAFETIVDRQVTLPSPTVGHAAEMAQLDERLAGLPLFITGNYFAGLALEDCVSRSEQEFRRLLSFHKTTANRIEEVLS